MRFQVVVRKVTNEDCFCAIGCELVSRCSSDTESGIGAGYDNDFARNSSMLCQWLWAMQHVKGQPDSRSIGRVLGDYRNASDTFKLPRILSRYGKLFGERVEASLGCRSHDWVRNEGQWYDWKAK